MGLAAFNRRRRVATPAQPEPTPETRNDIAPQPETGIPVNDPLAPAVARLAELKAIYAEQGWKPIKELGDGRGVKKHPDGWDSSLLMIIEAEFSSEIANALAEQEAA